MLVGIAEPPVPARRPEPEPAAVVETRIVRKSFGRQVALPELTAAFPGGWLTVVTGPSGSGKTTLLRLIAGLDLPSGGEVVVLGSQVARLGRSERAALRRSSIALVAQGAALLGQLSARENVELGLAIRGVPRTDGEGRTTEALKAVGLAELAGQRVGRLSAGERQRVSIARALAARPAVLLVDEPTARLDEANALAVGVLLAKVARELGTCVICATHDPLVIEQADANVALSGKPVPPSGAATISGRPSTVPR